MAVWSLCLNTLTDRPTQGFMPCLCIVRPPASILARFPLTMTYHLDYHHVYSYVTTSKNDFVPCSNSGHTPVPNTDKLIGFLLHGTTCPVKREVVTVSLSNTSALQAGSSLKLPTGQFINAYLPVGRLGPIAGLVAISHNTTNGIKFCC